jgi:hypothetical protein
VKFQLCHSPAAVEANSISSQCQTFQHGTSKFHNLHDTGYQQQLDFQCSQN